MAQAHSSSHQVALDGLRGAAAAVVIVYHCFNAVAMPRDVRRALFEGAFAPFLNGQGAVNVFFVLSGWALASSLARGRGVVDWPVFYTKRVFRIHPPYVFGLLFAWGASFFYVRDFGSERGLTHVMWQMAQVQLAPAELFVASLFPGTAGGQLAVGWTLRVEMIFSGLLPLLAVAARWRRGIPLVAASLATLALSYAYRDLWYAGDFAAGVVLFQERDAVRRALRRTPRALHVVWPALAMLILCAPNLLGWTLAGGGVLVTGFDPRDVLVMIPGAALLVASADALPGVERVMSHPVLVFLGRISFSLYLLHIPILNLLAPRIVEPGYPASGFALGLALIAVVVPAATAAHRWIELPSIALGNRVCRRLAARFGSRPIDSHAAETE
jgi:peptidoglycan/LPS O-acetylase OafA/YrhL